MRTKIDPNDFDDVVWLQVSLTKLMGDHAGPFLVGQLDKLGEKTVRRYQRINGLPVTGVADEATLQHIEHALTVS